MPRRPIVKREPATVTAEQVDRLAARGWHLQHHTRWEPDVWTHPRLAHPWPGLDALRLESERDAGNRAAVRLLGRAPAT